METHANGSKGNRGLILIRSKVVLAGARIQLVILALFAVLFTILFANVLFNNMHFQYSPFLVVVLACAWLGIAALLYRLTGKFGAVLAAKEKRMLALFSLVLLLTQLWFYWQLGAYPTRDFERVFTGAVNYAVNGYIQEPYLDYFYKYPNNMPLTILFQFSFRVANRLGFRDFYTLGAAIGAVCIWLTYLFVYLSIRYQFGVGKGFLALGLLYLCLPLQTYISIYYTDVIALPFIPFAYYAYLAMRGAPTFKKSVMWALLLGGVTAFGAQIKYSVAIILIAILLDLLLRAEVRRLGMAVVAFLLFFFVFQSAFTIYMYSSFLEEEGAADKATPFLSWIMMGLARDGAHNPADNDMIWYWPTAEQKQQQAVEEIENRLESFTPLSFLQFLNQKGVRSFGSGNFDYPHTVADSPMRQTFMVECVSENGRYFQPFDTLTQGYHVMLFSVITAGAFAMVLRRKTEIFVPHLAILGHYLFLLLWESGQRYLLHYMGIYTIAAVVSLILLADTIGLALKRGKTHGAKSTTKR